MIMPDVGAQPLLEVAIAGKTRRRAGETIAIIDNLTFTLHRHEVTCLLGPSGCGKTTALRIIMGLDDAFEGRITPDTRALRLGVVFQEPRLLPWRSVADNILIAAPDLHAAALDSLLEELGLAAWRDTRPNQLSLGMARRVALGRALAVDPDLLILDEAFVSLDEKGADALRSVVFGAVARRRATVLMVTHNVREALEHSDTILVLAPRPTSVIDVIDLGRDRTVRDQAWLTLQRQKLMAVEPGFLDTN